MSGSTDFWRNEPFTQTSLPASGNKALGANRDQPEPQLCLDSWFGAAHTPPDMAQRIECVRILKALADETRWRIVRELLKRTLNVSELTERLGATQYNVSKHLRILREAGLVTTEKEGKNLNCCVDPELKRKIARNKNQLDMGCCTFRFD